jgi:hypothetical protein
MVTTLSLIYKLPLTTIITCHKLLLGSSDVKYLNNSHQRIEHLRFEPSPSAQCIKQGITLTGNHYVARKNRNRNHWPVEHFYCSDHIFTLVIGQVNSSRSKQDYINCSLKCCLIEIAVDCC